MSIYRALAVMVMAMMMTTAANVAAAAGQPTCSNVSLAGGYGFSITGTNTGLGVEYALVGQFTADGQGALVGKGTQSVQGQIARAPFTGTYSVQADCSGTGTITFPFGITATLDFVIVHHGRELLLIVADAGTVETGTAKRIVRPRRR